MTTLVVEPLIPSQSAVTAEVTNSALRVGAMLMQSGASTDSSVVAVREMLAGLDHPAVDVSISGDAIIASTVVDGAPLTLMRPIPSLGANLERVSLLHVLVERVRRGSVRVDALTAELDAIAAAPAPYDRFAVAFALGLAGLAFNQLLGGTFASAALVFVANAVGHLARTELVKRASPAALTALLTAIVATAIAAFGVRMGVAPATGSTFIPAITLLIPGFALINGLLDLASLRYVMVGMQRVLIALLTFLVIGIGIATGIALIGG